jgi:hypothetical protein
MARQIADAAIRTGAALMWSLRNAFVGPQIETAAMA